MVLSLFFSVTSALVSTLIQQWAREYLQYSQPSAAPHKRGRMRAYLFDGLIRFQMKRLTYGVPVLLHVSVFLFFYALSEWLYSVNVAVGATARYCLVALLAVYMALSVLPLVVRNAPYQTALTTPLRACVSLIQVSYIGLCRLVRCSSRAYEGQKGSGLFKSVHVDRARALMKDIKKRASELDRSAMHWLLQELDEDDMDTFLSGLPGYIHSPLTDKNFVVEGLVEDGLPGRIREHIITCLRSVELSPEESMSRASACITSLRLISETTSTTAQTTSTTVRKPGSESDDIQSIMEYLEPLCSNSSTALRASCIRGLVIREFLIPFANLDAEELRTKKFPNHLKPLYRVIRVWKTTEISQWSHLASMVTTTSNPLSIPPSDREMWADVAYDGPLINLAVLANAILLRVGEEDVNLGMAWKTIETLLKSLSLAQVQVTPPARARFDEVLMKARAGNSGNVGRLGGAQITPLLKTLDTVISGLRLAEAFAHTPKSTLLPRQIEAIFGPEQLRDNELLEAFAAHLPGFVNTNTPEVLKTFMEHLILEDKLWEQLHVSILSCSDPQVPIPDKFRVIVAFFNIFDMVFEVLQDSSMADWQSLDLFLISKQLWGIELRAAPGKFKSFGKVINFRAGIFRHRYYHALLGQFSMQRSRGEPFSADFLEIFTTLVWCLGVGTTNDLQNLTPSNTRTGTEIEINANAVLGVALRDGPLSHFCTLGRFIYVEMVSEVSGLSHLTTDDTTKMWNLLDKMLITPQLPLVNASGETWARFDHLRASIRNYVLVGHNNQAAEKLQRLLDVIEKVERMRSFVDGRNDGMGNANGQIQAGGSVGQGPWQPGVAPIPGSSRVAYASWPAPEGTWDQRPFHPAPGTVPTTGLTPHSWVPSGQPDLMANEPPTSSISVPSTFPPHFPLAHPQSFASPHASQVHLRSFVSPHDVMRTSMDPTNLQAQAYMQFKPVPADNPILPWHMHSNPYPFPIPSSGLAGVPPPNDTKQHNLIDEDEVGPGFHVRDGT